MRDSEPERATSARLLRAWCERHGSQASDPRLTGIAEVVPLELLREVLDGEPSRTRPRLILRRLGDPRRFSDAFWKHVSFGHDRGRSAIAAGLTAERLGRARLTMRLSDLLVVLRAVDADDDAHRARIDEKQDAEAARREREALAATFDSEGNLLSDVRRFEHRVPVADTDSDVEPDDADASDAEDSASDRQDEMEAERELDEDEMTESEADDDFDTEIDEDWTDPVDALLGDLAGQIRGAFAAYSTHRAMPAEILRRASELVRAGCPERAAWFLAQADAETDAVQSDVDDDEVRDQTGIVVLLSKGLEAALRDHLLEVRHRRGRSDAHHHARSMLGNIVAALREATTRGGRSWPSEVPEVGSSAEPAPLRPDRAAAPPIRLAWIAAGVSAVSQHFRNGYMHRDVASARMARNFRAFLLGASGFVAFLVSGAVTPSAETQATIRLVLKRGYGAKEPTAAWLSETTAYWAFDDEAAAAASAGVALPPPPSDPTQLAELAAKHAVVFGKYDEEHEQHRWILSNADHGSESAETWAHLREPTFEPWPRVRIAVGIETGAGGLRALQASDDLGDLQPPLSTLRWRVSPDRVVVEWWASGEAWTERIALSALGQFAHSPSALPGDVAGSRSEPTGTPGIELRIELGEQFGPDVFLR